VNRQLIKKNILLTNELDDKKESLVDHVSKFFDKNEVAAAIGQAAVFIFLIFALVFILIYFFISILLDYIVFTLLISYIIVKLKYKQTYNFGELLFKKTIIPFSVVLLLLSICIFLIQKNNPQIETIGAVLKPLLLKIQDFWIKIQS